MTSTTSLKLVSVRYAPRSYSILLGVLVLAISGCTLHDPYSGQRSSGPVDVRRGDQYNKPVYQQTRPQNGQYQEQQQGYGRPAPEVNRPAYPTNPERLNNSSNGDPFETQAIEQPVPAVARLVTRAENFIKEENYSAAAASAESALRLDPQSISAYHTLARTYLFEGRFGESEQMGLRALSILRSKGANADHAMSKNLWLLIAETRRRRGDSAGAEKAMQQSGGRY